jgi:cell division protein ZapA
MSNMQIRIKIAEKEYTLRVNAPEEEALLRQAAKQLNEKIKAFQKQTGIWDKQDLLAMVAFDGELQQLKHAKTSQKHQAKLDELSLMVEQALKGD